MCAGVTPRTDGIDEALASLSEEQLEVLQHAAKQGFFERPQRHTADDLAGDLGLSRTTVLRRIRSAEEAIFLGAFNLQESRSRS